METVLVAMPPRPRRSPRNKGKRVKFEAGGAQTLSPKTPPTTARKKPTERRPTPETSSPKEADKEGDRDRVPATFPAKPLGGPTPGTINLNEPPSRTLPPPPATQSVNMPRMTTLLEAKRVYNTLQEATKQSRLLYVDLFKKAKREEENALDSALVSSLEPTQLPLQVQLAPLDDQELVKFNQAHSFSHLAFSYTTLKNTAGELQIEGHTPRIAVLDTGAGRVILGETFASHLERCQLLHSSRLGERMNRVWAKQNTY